VRRRGRRVYLFNSIFRARARGDSPDKSLEARCPLARSLAGACRDNARRTAMLETMTHSVARGSNLSRLPSPPLRPGRNRGGRSAEGTFRGRNRRYESNGVFSRRPTYAKRELPARTRYGFGKLFRALFPSFSPSLFPPPSVYLSLPRAHYTGRPRSASVLATGGCTGVSCQRHHLHRFVPFVPK